MKDFAKSIHVGNANKAEIIEKKKKEGATLKVDNGQKLEFSDGSTYVKTSFSNDYREAHNYVGNAKTGNAGGNLDAAAARDIREMAAKYWHSGIHDTRQLATTVAWEWAKKSKTVRDTTQDLVSEVKDIIDRSLNEIKTGNKKVGNANTHLTASNSGELWLNFDGTGDMYDPIELGRYSFSGKSEALSVARELEQLKRKAEQKVKDADKFINAIKNWASGLK